MVRALAPGLKADKACVGFVGLKPHAPSVNYRAIFLYTCWRDALRPVPYPSLLSKLSQTG